MTTKFHREHTFAGRFLRIGTLAIMVALADFANPLAALAQSSTAPVAELLFQEAHRELAAGRVHEACLKFAESQRLDPAVGTVLNLAMCHEREGLLASAWAEYSLVITLAARKGQKAREGYAREKCRTLEPRLNRLVISRSAAKPDEVISLDGAQLGPSSLSAGIPLDPGVHRIEVTGPSRRAWTRDVSIEPQVSVVRIDIPPPEVAIPSTPIVSKESIATVDIPRRIAGYGLATIGAVAAGFAVVYASNSAVRASHADDARAEQDTALAQGLDDQASTLRTYAVIAGGLAVAGIGTGIYCILTSTRPPRAARTVHALPWVTPNGASIAASVSF